MIGFMHLNSTVQSYRIFVAEAFSHHIGEHLSLSALGRNVSLSEECRIEEHFASFQMLADHHFVSNNIIKIEL